MATRIQIVSIISTAAVFGLVFELVRRRRLMERYALLWMFSSGVLLGLAVWQSALERLASTIGIYYAPSALFAIALASVFVLLMHFSLVISRLVDQTKVLAQQVGMLTQRIDELEDEQIARAANRAPPITEDEPASTELTPR